MTLDPKRQDEVVFLMVTGMIALVVLRVWWGY